MATDKSTNPYENADPIRVGRGNHRKVTLQSRTPTRSRSVQSARDAANGALKASRAKPTPRGTTQTSHEVRRPIGRTRHIGPEPCDPNDPKAPQTAMRTRRKMGFGILAGIIIACIAVLAWLLYYINRPVPITVDGEAAEVKVGSTLEDVLHENHVSVMAGNYVSVCDQVLAEGAGNPFTAAVNGVELTPEEARAYRVVGSEAIEFSDGTDIIEDYDFFEAGVWPYLKMEGSGYAIQYVSQWGRMGTLEHRTGKESGQEAEVITQEPQDCIITCREFLFEDQKLVALTFDDGPLSPYTEQYLDIMARYGVKGTFFFLGDSVTANPDLARRVVAEGHQVANHTMAHNQLTSVEPETVLSEITRSADVLQAATGVRSTHLRPPYGDFTERSWLGTGGSISAAIRWTGDSEDWRLPGAQAIVDKALLNVHSGSIILMHDGGGDRSQDVEALPMLIERLQAEGYQFVTISDLMRAAGDIPEDVCSGTATMPEGCVWPQEIHPDDIAATGAV